ncbi:uncharacterized protein LOC107036880 [Diachasma alloeum]|uniref:uncharacterized protein LOC107036880 n=1 Tax=Diachasma alloeum TaxID=454923 RepID=UPI0007384E6E|nr:uncharacterized protein LOC107036880 [Diachasma alloeum]
MNGDPPSPNEAKVQASVTDENAKIPPPSPGRRSGEVKKPVTQVKCPRVPSVPRPPSSGTPKVFVRLKPSPKGVKLRREPQRYCVVSPSLFLNLSDVDQDPSTNVDVVEKRFVFSEAFGDDDDQMKLFDRVVEPQMLEYFNGADCTVMTYGTPQSGKSHTLVGSPRDPGLIPRTLEYIFSLEKPTRVPNYKPSDSTISCLTLIERFEELDTRREFLSPQSQEEMDLYADKTHVPQKGCELWVSFAELRDEAYFDLLSPNYLQVHSPLILETDLKGKTYIRGLTHLSVGSAPEACDVLAFGRDRLLQWSSSMKTTASQSHSIFTVTLLRYRGWDDAGSVQTSRFSFCDLAGHTSPKLDSSLLAVLRCLESTKERHPPKATECFCPSSLTSLFSDAFTRKTPLSVILTVDPSPKVYKETHTILHWASSFSEVHTKIRRPYPSSEATTTFGKIAETPQKTVDWEDLTAEKLMELSGQFQNEIEELKARNLVSDVQARQRSVSRYALMIKRIENSYKRKSEAESHSENVEGLKAISQRLRSQKQLLERELVVCQGKLADVPPELCGADESRNPHVTLLDEILAERDARGRNENLIKMLKEARAEYLRVTGDTREKERKIGEIERKTLALRLDRDCELTNQKIVNEALREKMGVVVIMEGRLQRDKKYCRRYLEEMSQKFGGVRALSVEGSPGGAGGKEESRELGEIEASLGLNTSAADEVSPGTAPVDFPLPEGKVESQTESGEIEEMEKETQFVGGSLDESVMSSYSEGGVMGASEERGPSHLETSAVDESVLVKSIEIPAPEGPPSDLDGPQLPTGHLQVNNNSTSTLTPLQSEFVDEDPSAGGSEELGIEANVLLCSPSAPAVSSVRETSPIVSSEPTMQVTEAEVVDSLEAATDHEASSLENQFLCETNDLPLLVAAMTLADHDYAAIPPGAQYIVPPLDDIFINTSIISESQNDGASAVVEMNSNGISVVEEQKDDVENQETSPSSFQVQSPGSPLAPGILGSSETQVTVSESKIIDSNNPEAVVHENRTLEPQHHVITPPVSPSTNPPVQNEVPTVLEEDSNVMEPVDNLSQFVMSEEDQACSPSTCEAPSSRIIDDTIVSGAVINPESLNGTSPNAEGIDALPQGSTEPEEDSTRRSTRKRPGTPVIPSSVKHSKQNPPTPSRRGTRRPATPNIPSLRESVEPEKSVVICNKCGGTITDGRRFRSKNCGKCSSVNTPRRSARRRPGTPTIATEDHLDPELPLVTCDHCFKRITDKYRFHCKTCNDGNFDLCKACYSEVSHKHEVKMVPTIPEEYIQGRLAI